MKSLHLGRKPRGVVAANNAKMKRVMREEGHGFKKYGKPLIAPVIADQEQDDVTGRIAELLVRRIPQSLAGTRREQGMCRLRWARRQHRGGQSIGQVGGAYEGKRQRGAAICVGRCDFQGSGAEGSKVSDVDRGVPQKGDPTAAP